VKTPSAPWGCSPELPPAFPLPSSRGESPRSSGNHRRWRAYADRRAADRGSSTRSAAGSASARPRKIGSSWAATSPAAPLPTQAHHSPAACPGWPARSRSCGRAPTDNPAPFTASQPTKPSSPQGRTRPRNPPVAYARRYERRSPRRPRGHPHNSPTAGRGACFPCV